MKNWQHGFELDYLKEIEKKFESWNSYAQHELTKFKKNTIAPALANKEVIIVDDSLVHWKQTKVKTKVEMLPGLLCAERQPGDIIVHRIAYGSETDTVGETSARLWGQSALQRLRRIYYYPLGV